MRLKVKLFSVLREYVTDYDPELGLDVDLAPGARVSDLILHLKIPEEKAPVVSCNGRVLKAGDLLENDSVIHLFQLVAGG